MSVLVLQPSILVTQGVNLNSANTDFPVPIPFNKYIARKVTASGPSVSLASSPATLGLFTLANGGGTAIIPLTTLTSLNGITKFADVTLTFTNFGQLSQVFIRVGTAHGSPATIDVYLYLDQLV